MDNHFRIVIQPMDQKLQQIVHQINNKYKRVRPGFQGRYKSVLVQAERYMLKLIRYIHQNPVREDMANRVEQYKWSSDIYYRKNINSFINKEAILRMLDVGAIAAIARHYTLKEIGDHIGMTAVSLKSMFDRNEQHNNLYTWHISDPPLLTNAR